MKQYIYSAAEANLADWPSGTLRLDGIEVTEDPNAADVIVYPGALHTLRPPDLDKLPYMRDHEEKHVFFHNADHTDRYGKKCIFLRCNMRPWNFESDPNSIAWPWGVNPKGDLDQCVEVPSKGYTYDVSFVGWNSGLVRKVSANSCKNHGKIHADVTLYPDFFGYLEDTPEGHRRRADFIRSLKESCIILCPESIPGVLPYRFFEALAAGRYPLLIGHDYALPFSDRIPYDEFMSKLTNDDAMDAGYAVAEIRSRHTDAVFREKGQMARKYWSEFMDGAHWPRLMAEEVKRKLGVLQAA